MPPLQEANANIMFLRQREERRASAGAVVVAPAPSPSFHGGLHEGLLESLDELASSNPNPGRSPSLSGSEFSVSSGSGSSEGDEADDVVEDDDDDDDYSPTRATKSHARRRPKKRSRSSSSSISDGKAGGVAGRGDVKRRRKLWLQEEDDLLRGAMARALSSRPEKIPWGDVSRVVPNRNSKQCRDRWQTIDGSVERREWTPSEDVRLFRRQREYVNKWVQLSKEFTGRNANQVKSRFRALVKAGFTEASLVAKLHASETADPEAKSAVPVSRLHQRRPQPQPQPQPLAKQQRWEPQQLPLPQPQPLQLRQHQFGGVAVKSEEKNVRPQERRSIVPMRQHLPFGNKELVLSSRYSPASVATQPSTPVLATAGSTGPALPSSFWLDKRSPTEPGVEQVLPQEEVAEWCHFLLFGNS